MPFVSILIKVKFYGQIIAAVVAVTQDIAEKAATLIDVTYEPLPCLTTIQVYSADIILNI